MNSDGGNMKNAFSLVELSIVLVILGLLTGGILTGQSLIRASELRAVTTEFQRYTAAVQTFRDKYFAIPGDMANATKFWGIAAGTGSDATCQAFSSTTPATCDGNNSGGITAGGNEQFRFWQHLANAGLIEGTYTGTAGAGGSNHHIPATNCPSSKMGNSGWGTRAVNTGDFTGTFFLANRNNTLLFGAPATNTHMVGVNLKPEEAWNIDTKMDDGKPGYGSIESNFTATCTNAANNTDNANATYSLTLSAVGCSLLFKNPF